MYGDKGRRKELKKDKERPAHFHARDGLRLLGYRGCMACGKQRTRTVHMLGAQSTLGAQQCAYVHAC